MALGAGVGSALGLRVSGVGCRVIEGAGLKAFSKALLGSGRRV